MFSELPEFVAWFLSLILESFQLWKRERQRQRQTVREEGRKEGSLCNIPGKSESGYHQSSSDNVKMALWKSLEGEWCSSEDSPETRGTNMWEKSRKARSQPGKPRKVGWIKQEIPAEQAIKLEKRSLAEMESMKEVKSKQDIPLRRFGQDCAKSHKKAEPWSSHRWGPLKDAASPRVPVHPSKPPCFVDFRFAWLTAKWNAVMGTVYSGTWLSRSLLFTTAHTNWPLSLSRYKPFSAPPQSHYLC